MNAHIIDKILPIQMWNFIHFSFPNDISSIAASGCLSFELNQRWLTVGEIIERIRKIAPIFISMNKRQYFLNKYKFFLWGKTFEQLFKVNNKLCILYTIYSIKYTLYAFHGFVMNELCDLYFMYFARVRISISCAIQM